jgi:acyl-CoA thioesterase
MPIDGKELAQRVGEAMMARDRASRGLGIKIEDIGPGYACLSMTVRGDMLNGHDICHGGFMFTLADSAFAFACNSRNESTVAAGCSIEFLRPVREGEQLRAEAREQVLSGRTGIYDIAVLDEAGQMVAMFRGKSARIKGEVIAP